MLAKSSFYCYEDGVTERVNALPPLTTWTLLEARMATSKTAQKRRFRKTLTAERLKDLLHYDPDTGIFTWLVDRGRMRCKGKRAGSPEGQIRIDFHIYRPHRLAWLYMTGEWPKHLIDHADRDPSNNRWANLREATDQQNMWNGRSKLPKSGFRGVKRHRNGFVAFIYEGKRGIYLGSFKTAEEASAAHVAAVNARRGEFACAEVFVPPRREGG